MEAKEVKLKFFGDGPWVNEPDEEIFQFEGLDCFLSRSLSGCWCGHVKLPSGHPWIEKSYEEIDIDIHGGLTFKGTPQNISLEGEWIGFDCAHFSDIIPGCEDFLKKSTEDLKEKIPNLKKVLENPNRPQRTYKDINYAREETKSLALQVKNAMFEKSKQGHQPEDQTAEKQLLAPEYSDSQD